MSWTWPWGPSDLVATAFLTQLTQQVSLSCCLLSKLYRSLFSRHSLPGNLKAQQKSKFIAKFQNKWCFKLYKSALLTRIQYLWGQNQCFVQPCNSSFPPQSPTLFFSIRNSGNTQGVPKILAFFLFYPYLSRIFKYNPAEDLLSPRVLACSCLEVLSKVADGVITPSTINKIF